MRSITCFFFFISTSFLVSVTDEDDTCITSSLRVYKIVQSGTLRTFVWHGEKIRKGGEIACTLVPAAVTTEVIIPLYGTILHVPCVLFTKRANALKGAVRMLPPVPACACSAHALKGALWIRTSLVACADSVGHSSFAEFSYGALLPLFVSPSAFPTLGITLCRRESDHCWPLELRICSV